MGFAKVRKFIGYVWVRERIGVRVVEELNDLYCSPNILRVIKWRRMRWAGHVASMDEERGCIGSCWGNRRERDHWGDLGVDGWIILGWTCGERGVYRVLGGKPVGKRPLGRPRLRWVNNIRMDLWREWVYRFLLGTP